MFRGSRVYGNILEIFSVLIFVVPEQSVKTMNITCLEYLVLYSIHVPGYHGRKVGERVSPRLSISQLGSGYVQDSVANDRPH